MFFAFFLYFFFLNLCRNEMDVVASLDDDGLRVIYDFSSSRQPNGKALKSTRWIYNPGALLEGR
jgi:hypothetical protein